MKKKESRNYRAIVNVVSLLIALPLAIYAFFMLGNFALNIFMRTAVGSVIGPHIDGNTAIADLALVCIIVGYIVLLKGNKKPHE